MKDSIIRSILCILIPIFGCKQQQADPDICIGKKPTDYKFQTYMQVGSDYVGTKARLDTLIPINDTLDLVQAEFGSVIFKANDLKLTTYQWNVGNDARLFTKSSFSLYFEKSPDFIPITLKTTNTNALKKCFPEDSGIYSYTKPLVIHKFKYNHPLRGTYRGANLDAPLDTFEIKIDTSSKCPYCNSNNIYDLFIQNLPNGFKAPKRLTFRTRKYFFFARGEPMVPEYPGIYYAPPEGYFQWNVSGEGNLLEGNKLKIEYQHDQKPLDKGYFYSPKTFLGFKLY